MLVPTYGQRVPTSAGASCTEHGVRNACAYVSRTLDSHAPSALQAAYNVARGSLLFLFVLASNVSRLQHRSPLGGE